MFGIEKDFQKLMEQVYGPLNKDKMTDLKFTSPSGETTIKVQDTGRLGTVAPKTQLHIKMDEPVQYETPMTENEEEIEKVKAQIKVLEKKLSFLEEIEKQPRMNLQQEGEYAVVSYHDKVYYRLMNETTFSWYKRIVVIPSFPTPTLVMVEDAETERLLEGLYYNHIQVKKEKEQRVKDAVHESKKWCEENPDKDPLDWLKPQTPEQTEQGLKEAFREAVKQGIIPEIKQPTDELIEKLVKKPPEFLKFELGKSLTDLIYQWWGDVFTTHSDWDMETSIEDLVDQIQMWLPKEQSAAGSQSLGVEDMVEGFNDCLKKIKGKLR